MCENAVNESSDILMYVAFLLIGHTCSNSESTEASHDRPCSYTVQKFIVGLIKNLIMEANSVLMC